MNRLDWSSAPEGAVDVRKAWNGESVFTDGMGKYYHPEKQLWEQIIEWSTDVWPVVEKRLEPPVIDPLCGYKWGEEYTVNGTKPNLTDDILVRYKTRNGTAANWRLKNISWGDIGDATVETIRIIDPRYAPQSPVPAAPAPLKSPVTSATDQAAYYLNTGLSILHERGQQYDITGNGERSFAAVATAFNAITGDNLKGSDVCLILQVLKDVRQYSNPSRIHADSLVDKVNYGALHAAELVKESK